MDTLSQERGPCRVIATALMKHLLISYIKKFSDSCFLNFQALQCCLSSVCWSFLSLKGPTTAAKTQNAICSQPREPTFSDRDGRQTSRSFFSLMRNSAPGHFGFGLGLMKSLEMERAQLFEPEPGPSFSNGAGIELEPFVL